MSEACGIEVIESSVDNPFMLDEYALSSSTTGCIGYVNPSIDLAWEVYFKLTTDLDVTNEKDYI